MISDLAMPCTDGFTFGATIVAARRARANRRCASVRRSAALRTQHGFSMCSPSLVVAKLAIPTSMPAWRPDAAARWAARITREHQHPAPALPFDLDRLHSTHRLAMHVNLDLADAFGDTPDGPRQPANAVTVPGRRDRVEAGLALEPRITGLLPRLTPEDPVERLTEPRAT